MQPVIDDEAVLHVLAIQTVTSGMERGGDDHAVVESEAVALGDSQAELMVADRQRHDCMDTRAYQRQTCVDLFP